MKNVITQNKKIEDYFMKRGKLFVLSVIVGLLVLSPSNVALADHCTVSKIAIIPGPWENTANLIAEAINKYLNDRPKPEEALDDNT